MTSKPTPLLSRYIKEKRTGIILPYIKGNVLDLGCGFTKIPQYLNASQQYCGVDYNQKAIQWSRQKYPGHQFVRADVNLTDLQLDSQYDTILLIAVLEHIQDPNQLFKQITKYLSSSGRLIITTPTPLGGFMHSLGAKIGLFYREAAGDHKRFHNLNSMMDYLHMNNLAILEYKKFMLSMNQLFKIKILIN